MTSVARVRAFVQSPHAPARRGVILSAVAAGMTTLLTIFSIVLMAVAPEAPAGILLLMFTMMALPTAAHLYFGLRGRPKGQTVDLDVLPGEVRATEGGFVVRARDVIGASTAPLAGKLLLSLETKDAAAPHALLFDDLESLESVRRALGLQHGGTGAVAWPVKHGTLRWFGIIGALTAMVCTGVNMLMMLAWPFLLAWPRKTASGERVGLTAAGVTHGGVTYPYDWIEGATATGIPKSLTLWRAGQMYANIPCPALAIDEIERVAAQINAAARRARGEVVHRESALERLALVRRGASEPRRSWLARLEALSSSVGADNYRAAPVGIEDLWKLAEDSDEPVENRVGAARMLLRARGPEVRARVDAALANVREPETRLRVALEAPPDVAGEVLENLEAEGDPARMMARRL